MDSPQLPVEKLVKVYIKMREKHAELLHEFQKQEEGLKEKASNAYNGGALFNYLYLLFREMWVRGNITDSW